jgi:hypothetical protein
MVSPNRKAPKSRNFTGEGLSEESCIKWVHRNPHLFTTLVNKLLKKPYRNHGGTLDAMAEASPYDGYFQVNIRIIVIPFVCTKFNEAWARVAAQQNQFPREVTWLGRFDIEFGKRRRSL